MSSQNNPQNDSGQEIENLTSLETLTSEAIAAITNRPVPPSVLTQILNLIEGNFSSYTQVLGININAGSSAPVTFFSGTKLCYAIGSSLYTFDLVTKATVQLTNTSPYPNWSDTNKASVLGTYILDDEGHYVLKNGVQLQEFVLQGGYILFYGFSISKDGKYIVVTQYDGSNYWLSVWIGNV
jgi:hypothetical protein